MSSSVLKVFVHDSLLWRRPSSFARSLVYMAIVVAASLAGARWAYSLDGVEMLETHTSLSLELAMARAFCGGPSSLSPTVRLPREIVGDPVLRARPLRALVVERAGSMDAYCDSLAWPFVQAENSLMVTEAALLWAMPDLSLNGMVQGLHAVRVLLLMAFVLLLLDLGASLALAGATLLCGLMILQSMPDRAYAHYPFLFVLVLALTAVHVFAIKYRWVDRRIGLVLYGLFAGALSAYTANMRTSYLAIAAVMFSCVLAAEFGRRRDARLGLRAGRVAALVACFIAGYAIFQVGMITRYLPDAGRYEAAHTTAHPVVLALAVPENPFSQAMGIRWDDAVGIEKAATVDPKAAYLSKPYNDALMTYYWSLWRDHTREMIGVYYLKFSVAGADMLVVLRRSPGTVGWLVRMLLTPVSWLPNGLWLLALYGVIGVGAVVRFYRHQSLAAFALVLLTLAAGIVQVESSVIFPIFVKQYHNYAVFYVLFISLLGVQALANGGWAWIAPRLIGRDADPRMVE